MHWLAWVFVAIGILGVLLLATGWWRYALTGLLIARVTRYEQPGGGAGSILFIGDSTGYGTGADRSADSVAGRLGNDYTWYTITNDSVNGRKISGAKAVIDTLTEDDQYDLIVFQIGANDMLGGASATETVARMRTLVDAARPHAEQIVILTCGNLGGPPLFTGDEAAQLTRTAKEYDDLMFYFEKQFQDVSFVSLFDEPAQDPFLLEPKKYTSIDGLHPSSAGYGVWYENAKGSFAEILEKE